MPLLYPPQVSFQGLVDPQSGVTLTDGSGAFMLSHVGPGVVGGGKRRKGQQEGLAGPGWLAEERGGGAGAAVGLH